MNVHSRFYFGINVLRAYFLTICVIIFQHTGRIFIRYYAFFEKLDATSLRVRSAIEVLWIKLARTRSDIAFLSQCRIFNLIPKGLALRNPVLIRMEKTDNICKKASGLLRNHAL